MAELMGVIHNSQRENSLEEITQFRSIGAVPFGGRYRLIDFCLSNLVYSGIQNIAVFPYTQYRSLTDHLGSGKDWDLDRKQDGLFILPPPVHANFLKTQNLASFYEHRDYFQRSNQQYVVLTNSYVLCNIDYRAVVQYHERQEADVTLICQQLTSAEQERSCTYALELCAQGFVTNIAPPASLAKPYHFLDMIILERELLLYFIDMSSRHNARQLIKDILIPYMQEFRIAAFEHSGYIAFIDGVSNYFKHSMDLLQPAVAEELFLNSRPVLTKIKDEPPTRYKSAAHVSHSLIANGCVIEGEVENSIIFRGVNIERGAVVRNSIVMQKSEIEADALLNHVIVDKDVCITRHRHVQGTAAQPEIISKNKIY